MPGKRDKTDDDSRHATRRAVPSRFGMDEVLWAAWLYYEEGQKQDKIADLLGISRASVFNLLQKARDEGIVNISIDPSRIARADVALELCELSGLSECYVLPTPQDPATLANEISHLGARVLEARLHADDTIGVAWGRTVLSLSEHLTSVRHPNITVAQITGSAVATFDFSPVLCTTNIADRLSARCVNLHAPGVVSTAQVKDILLNEPEIRNHFTLLQQCTKIIFGVTQLVGETLLEQSGFMSDAALQVYRDLGAVGFAAGYFFDAEGQIVRSEFDERHITMALDDLLNVPERICIGGAPQKVGAIYGMLQARIANVLVTDETTAQSLIDHYKQRT
ncbi:MAG: sugar-binding transcriptional regulator [Alphaproteobacteria bacterium]|nr:sugar-binding transcriptional regulator [Alphaproteobacteria bacterium]MBU1278104.1 sugar-binding transcriptional regulator [Alphaproteobacteria bacterium]MBU1573963.1 sugar-binding transcriptional regulator [Alphaproteobacteria bacterium]MBU1830409.1 sugar-binding transcriptional regulator [Alphaproteobacteria bacterium]MBU2077187.1 sugar-binding transcriptional regulator [Alphaproteobacteria bacterium]